MLHQPENEALTPQELRQALLSEIEASQQAIRELSDEQLEQITGGEVVPYGIPQSSLLEVVPMQSHMP